MTVLLGLIYIFDDITKGVFSLAPASPFASTILSRKPSRIDALRFSQSNVA
jgi:hypothetical protein